MADDKELSHEEVQRKRREWEIKNKKLVPLVRAPDETLHANGGMVGGDYAKAPTRTSMKALDKGGRTINDYAKLTPYGRR